MRINKFWFKDDTRELKYWKDGQLFTQFKSQRQRYLGKEENHLNRTF